MERGSVDERAWYINGGDRKVHHSTGVQWTIVNQSQGQK